MKCSMCRKKEVKIYKLDGQTNGETNYCFVCINPLCPIGLDLEKVPTWTTKRVRLFKDKNERRI